MEKQQTLFQEPSIETGKMLRDRGMKQSIDHANKDHIGWSEQAYSFLITWIKDKRTFMTEEAREASKDIVPEPPHTRAWGGIIIKASKNNLIRRVGFQQVTNPNAHCATAAVWAVIH